MKKLLDWLMLAAVIALAAYLLFGPIKIGFAQ